MVRCKIKQGGQETTLEAEAPFSVSVSDAEIEFERTVRLAMGGEGRVTVDLPATVYASRLRLEGSATVRTEEGIGFALPKVQKPRGAIQRRVLEKLDEADYTSQELSDELGLSLKQVQDAVTNLLRKGLVSRVGEKLHKAGVSRKDPRKVKNPGVAVVEG